MDEMLEMNALFELLQEKIKILVSDEDLENEYKRRNEFVDISDKILTYAYIQVTACKSN